MLLLIPYTGVPLEEASPANFHAHYAIPHTTVLLLHVSCFIFYYMFFFCLILLSRSCAPSYYGLCKLLVSKVSKKKKAEVVCLSTESRSCAPSYYCPTTIWFFFTICFFNNLSAGWASGRHKALFFCFKLKLVSSSLDLLRIFTSSNASTTHPPHIYTHTYNTYLIYTQPILYNIYMADINKHKNASITPPCIFLL